MKKKILALLVAVAIIVAMASCAGATITTNLTVNSMEGAGTKTISFKIHKDAETVHEENTKDDGTIEHVFTIYNNSTYFPKGYAAFMDWYIGTLPAADKFYYDIDETSDPDYLFINFKYDFTTYADYAKKTRDLVGEARWTKSEFVDPQLIAFKVEDPLDDHYGMIELVFVESHFLTQACVSTMLENAISQAAIDAGVYSPYGDCGSNPDCKEDYNLNKGTNDDGTEQSFKDFADVHYRGVCGNVSDVTGNPTYTFTPFNDEYTETRAADALRVFYVPDDGTYTLTDVTPFLPEGETEGKFYCDGEYLYALTAKEEAVGEDAAWIDGFKKTKIVLGKKPTDRAELEDGEEFGVLEGKNLGIAANFPWLIVGIAGGVVVVAAVVVIIAVVVKKKNEAADDDDEDEEEEEETEE